MEQRLVAAGQRRPDTFALGRRAPLGGRRDRAVVRREADQHGIAAVFLAYQLTHVQLAALAPVRGPRIAQMRVVRPNDNLRAAAPPLEMGFQRLQRLDHVAVAQVPRRHLLEEHRAVVRLGILHQARVLLGIEHLILRHATIAPRVLGGPALQLDQLADDLLLARLGDAGTGDEAVDLGVLAELVEARVTLARPLCRLGIDLFEEPEHGLHRGAQAIEVEAVEADFRRVLRKRVVVRPQPLDELDHVGVAPHPRRKASEVGERLYGIEVIAHASHVAVDAVRVGPIGFDRDRREAFLLDQPLGDLGALAVELVRAVRRLAEQREARIADQVHERVVVPRSAGQRLGAAAHRQSERVIGRARLWRPALGLASQREQLADLLVRGLREVLVPAAHGVERLRRDGADDLVDLRPQRFAGVGCCGRNRHHDARGLQLAQRLDGGEHSGPGRQPVIHEDYGATPHVRGRTTAAVDALAPLQLLQLPGRDRIDHVVRNAQAGHDVVVEHAHAAGRDGAHRHLLIAGHAQLAHDEHVQGRIERAGHFVSHGHAATGQGQDEHVGPIGVMRELLSEQPTGFAAIAKESRLHLSPPPATIRFRALPQYRSPIEPSARNRSSAPAIRGAMETMRSCGQFRSSMATVSVTNTSRTAGWSSLSRAPGSNRPWVAATMISGRAPASSSAVTLSATVPPVEIMSSTIRHARCDTSPTMWVTSVSVPLSRRLCKTTTGAPKHRANSVAKRMRPTSGETTARPGGSRSRSARHSVGTAVRLSTAAWKKPSIWGVCRSTVTTWAIPTASSRSAATRAVIGSPRPRPLSAPPVPQQGTTPPMGAGAAPPAAS